MHGRRNDKHTEHSRCDHDDSHNQYQGLNDVKLEQALQYFVAKEWDILFLIDTQQDMKLVTTW